MTNAEIKEAYTRTIQSYIDALDRYTDDQFAAKPEESEWSLGQMYEHLYNANRYFFLANVKRCLEKRKGREGGEKTPAGVNVYSYNSFPPTKVKAPDAARAWAIEARDREAYRGLFGETLREGQAWADALDGDDGRYKIEHFVFGWLNASEWMQGAEIHARHHFRQRREREQWLGIAAD